MKTVELEIYEAHKSLGLTISTLENGTGGGFRIFGPKLYGQGKTLRKETLDVTDIDMLISELKEAKKFLTKKEKKNAKNNR